MDWKSKVIVSLSRGTQERHIKTRRRIDVPVKSRKEYPQNNTEERYLQVISFPVANNSLQQELKHSMYILDCFLIYLLLDPENGGD
jgi:hypothetical protein